MTQRFQGGRSRDEETRPQRGEELFAAEANYAESIVRQAIGDIEGCVSALEASLEVMPTYAPALLSMGSVEYQRDRPERGRELFERLLDLPDDTPDLIQIIDEAGEFLIDFEAYGEGLGHYRRAVRRSPHVAALHQGLGCCAGHLELHAEAISASRAALALEPENQKLVNDLGWSLFQAGEIEEARSVLERAVAMDHRDERAANNLRACNGEFVLEDAGSGDV